MDDERARALLEDERRRVSALIAQTQSDSDADKAAAAETGDIADSAQPLTAEGQDDAVVSGLQARLAALDRAEQRLRDGTFGLSVRSGVPIPDERLEADPAAELTVEESAQQT